MTSHPSPIPIAVYLCTPCAGITCGHPYNWHSSDGCEVETCECIAFAINPTQEFPDDRLQQLRR